MKLHLNPFNRGNPLTWKDAAVISGLAATSTYVLTFLASASLGQIQADPAAFAFDSAKTWLVSFFGNFMTLSGLEHLMRKAETKAKKKAA